MLSGQAGDGRPALLVEGRPIQRDYSARRPDQGERGGTVPDLPAGEPVAGDAGFAVSADRRNEVRPAILDRGVRYETTTLEQAIKYANSSIDSTMRSNLTVGPPVDLAVYGRDEFAVSRQVRLSADDPMLIAIRTQWEQELRAAVQRLPTVTFGLR